MASARDPDDATPETAKPGSAPHYPALGTDPREFRSRRANRTAAVWLLVGLAVVAAVVALAAIAT